MRKMILRTIKEADISGKRVLVRVDFNVPLDLVASTRKVADDARIKAAIPTLEFLHAQGAAQIILLTHVGRPEGKVDEGLRVAPIEARLRELTDVPFELRENLRFDPREEKNDPEFAKELAGLGDLFVNEAFPVSHRSDTSIVGIPTLLPSFAGLRLEEEIKTLSEALTPPEHSVALIGGAKFETKEQFLVKLLASYEKVLLGGALGSDLLKARGLPVGASLVAGVIAPTSLAGEPRLIPPKDLIVTKEGGMARPARTGDVRAGEKIVDIGSHTAEAWSKEISRAQFVLWSGPMGIYEKGYTQGTDALAAAIVTAQCKALIGGGDTIAAIMKHTFDPKKVFLSTGGGAMLEFLVNGTLPGIEILRK